MRLRQQFCKECEELAKAETREVCFSLVWTLTGFSRDRTGKGLWEFAAVLLLGQSWGQGVDSQQVGRDADWVSQVRAGIKNCEGLYPRQNICCAFTEKSKKKQLELLIPKRKTEEGNVRNSCLHVRLLEEPKNI